MALIFSIFPINFELLIWIKFELLNWIKCFRSNQGIKCGVFLNRQQGRLFTFFVRCEKFALYHNKMLLRAYPCCRSVMKELPHAFFAVYISSYRCTREVWRALNKLELLLAAPRATLTHFSCSANFPCIHNSIYAP